MIGFALFEVQKGIDEILRNDSILLSLLGTGDANSILDNPSQYESNKFPYIAYSDISATPFDTKTSNGADVITSISVFSQSGDKSECSGILSRIYELVHLSDISVSGSNVSSTRWDEFSDIFSDDLEDGTLYQGVIRFKTTLSE